MRFCIWLLQLNNDFFFFNLRWQPLVITFLLLKSGSVFFKLIPLPLLWNHGKIKAATMIIAIIRTLLKSRACCSCVNSGFVGNLLREHFIDLLLLSSSLHKFGLLLLATCILSVDLILFRLSRSFVGLDSRLRLLLLLLTLIDLSPVS